MDPIEKIIERLKKEHGKNGTYSLLETWYKEDLTRESNAKEEAYDKIYGFIFGLYATNFITEKERKAAIKYLIEVMYKI